MTLRLMHVPAGRDRDPADNRNRGVDHQPPWLPRNDRDHAQRHLEPRSHAARLTPSVSDRSLPRTSTAIRGGTSLLSDSLCAPRTRARSSRSCSSCWRSPLFVTTSPPLLQGARSRAKQRETWEDHVYSAGSASTAVQVFNRSAVVCLADCLFRVCAFGGCVCSIRGRRHRRWSGSDPRCGALVRARPLKGVRVDTGGAADHNRDCEVAAPPRSC
jgi:hypothetical protein